MELKYYSYQANKELKPKGILLLLHGYGSNGQDLLSLAPELELAIPGLLYISVDAPFAWEGGLDGAYQWYSLKNRSSFIANHAQESFKILADNIDSLLKRYDLDYSHLVIAGFSQGGMMTMHSPTYLTQRPRGLISFSGYISVADYTPSIDVTGLPILITHGELDDVVDKDQLTIASNELKRLGCKVETHLASNLTHGIDYSCINAAGKFLREVFKSTDA